IKSDSSQSYEKIKAVELSENSIEDKLLYFNSGLEDKNGNLWMTTYGGGVWKYDGEKLSNFEINNGLEDVLLISIYQDKHGKIWLGTNNDGVYVQNEDKFEKFELTSSR
ncbi:MAG: two-component regulator propeller domain-containing protein, partial [Flavobacteriales bacterium]